MLRFILLLAFTAVVVSVETKAIGNEAKPLQSFGRFLVPNQEDPQSPSRFSHSEIGFAGLDRNDHALVEKVTSSKKKVMIPGK
jgi:hypothetical protein